MNRVTPEVIRSCLQMMAADPVEVAFRAIACLDADQREALQQKYNRVFGQCTPPMTMTISETSA